MPDLSQQTLNFLGAVAAIASAIAALTGMATAIIAFWAVRRADRNAQAQLIEARDLTEKQLKLSQETFAKQNESHKLTVAAEWLFKLDEHFDSGPFRSKRRMSAIALKGKKYEPVLEDIWDFFDTMGLLLRKGALDEEMIWSRFFYWINGYWKTSKDLLEERRGSETQIWGDFEYVYKAVIAWEEKQKPNSLDLAFNEKLIQEFLDDEAT